MVLSVHGVKKSFGGLVAVNDVSFELPAGQIMGLMGPNGAGKTTLVNVMCGFYKPDTGKITFQGKDVTGFPAHKACRIGMARTFQIPQPFWEMTALQNIAVAAMYARGLGKAEAETLTEKAKAYEFYNQAAVYQMILDKMPEIAGSISEPLSKIDKIVMIEQDGKLGTSKLTGQVVDIIAQLPEVVEALTGADIKEFLKKKLNSKE